jgi:hypothetical protein|tara:strand:+ start:7602 stop:8093 length:492 start_codon:yes stop_codon:yes gene_type:complete
MYTIYGKKMQTRQLDQNHIAKQKDVTSVYINNSHWWQNASFALPFIIGLISIIIGLILENAGAKGFGFFLLVVTLIMLPVVLLTWHSTATSIYLTKDNIVALHLGKVLKKIYWKNLTAIDTIEYLGNKRYKLVQNTDIYLVIDSEFTDVPKLLQEIKQISGIK